MNFAFLTMLLHPFHDPKPLLSVFHGASEAAGVGLGLRANRCNDHYFPDLPIKHTPPTTPGPWP